MNNVDKLFTRDPGAFTDAYFDYLGQVLKAIDRREVKGFVETLLAAREAGATIFFIGNGGSAATASHFANDLAVGTRSLDKPFRALALTDNVPILTAVGNDFGYDHVFSQQIQILGKPGDVLVGISASGNSPNLLEAFQAAKRLGIKTVALTAFDGGKMKIVADEGIHVPTAPKEYGPAEDAHMILDHLVHAYISRYIHA